jgi:hypothetical protein
VPRSSVPRSLCDLRASSVSSVCVDSETIRRTCTRVRER